MHCSIHCLQTNRWAAQFSRDSIFDQFNIEKEGARVCSVQWELQLAVRPKQMDFVTLSSGPQKIIKIKIIKIYTLQWSLDLRTPQLGKPSGIKNRGWSTTSVPSFLSQNGRFLSLSNIEHHLIHPKFENPSSELQLLKVLKCVKKGLPSLWIYSGSSSMPAV